MVHPCHSMLHHHQLLPHLWREQAHELHACPGIQVAQLNEEGIVEVRGRQAWGQAGPVDATVQVAQNLLQDLLLLRVCQL